MKKTRIILSFSAILQSILFAILLTILAGYVFGFRAYLVNGWSSEPEIQFGSLIIDYKYSYENLYNNFINSKENGENIYVTFGNKSYTTHTIVAMKPQKDQYFEVGDQIEFQNMGITFKRTITKKCQIVTMTNNYNSYKSFLKDIKNNHDGISEGTNGPSFEQNNFENISGQVVNIFEKTGQFLIFIKNNFMQIVVYVIIMYIAYEMFKFVPAYIKNY